MAAKNIDVAVIGGGPAGISASLELAKSSDLNIALFENDSELGGMPRFCHIFFGMRDRKRIYTGIQYARKLNTLVRKTPITIYTETRVLNIRPGGAGNRHQIEVISPKGFESYHCRFILLAMGCFEKSAGARQLPSQRPAGVYTTGSLQQMVNIYHQKPGKRAIIMGSEHIALSSLITLKRAGVSIAGIIEEDPYMQTYQLPAKVMSWYYNTPVYRRTHVKKILGKERVAGAELVGISTEKVFQVQCDTVIITGKFRPDSQLIDHTAIEMDPSTQGPLVDMNLMTSVPNIFAAGNVLRGALRHDLCALEGKMAAQRILNRLKFPETEIEDSISIRAEAPIRFVVPQKIAPSKTKSHWFSWLYPGYSIQLEKTLLRPVVEACSGNKIIWKRSFRKLIANSRILLPVHQFDWNLVDVKKGILLKLGHAVQ